MYLALPDGPGGFPQDFSSLAVLRILLVCKFLRVRDYHPLWFIFPSDSTSIYTHVAVLQPRLCRNKIGLGCSHFARRY
jgi:hypothetical protein